MPWQVQLDGDLADLEQLARTYALGSIRVVKAKGERAAVPDSPFVARPEGRSPVSHESSLNYLPALIPSIKAATATVSRHALDSLTVNRRVTAGGTDAEVTARAAVQVVVPFPAEELVSTAPAEQRVVAVVPDELVVA